MEVQFRREMSWSKQRRNQNRKIKKLHCTACGDFVHQLRNNCALLLLHVNWAVFNKESVLEILLDKTNSPECGKHLRNMKDVKELKLTPNSSFQEYANKGDAYDSMLAAQFICPVLGIEMNGKFKFVFIWTCGCVMSERSLKEIKTNTCHKCQQPFKDEDVIILNPTEEELTTLKTNMESRRAAAKGKNKNLKREASTSVEQKSGKGKKLKIDNANLNIAQKLIKLEDPDMAKVKSNYSVAKDPNASEVFKSLFTTHEKAKNQTKGHWVTYNPHFN